MRILLECEKTNFFFFALISNDHILRSSDKGQALTWVRALKAHQK